MADSVVEVAITTDAAISIPWWCWCYPNHFNLARITIKPPIRRTHRTIISLSASTKQHPQSKKHHMSNQCLQLCLCKTMAI
jgi:hypothetical protein